MADHVIFAAPFFMEATLRFIRGACDLEGVNLTLVSQDAEHKLPGDIRSRLAGHWQIADCLDPQQLVQAARGLEQRFGKAQAYIGTLEQLQVPLAIAREHMGLAGLGAEAARNFRDKSRMKKILEQADLPCARHLLATESVQAFEFAQTCGYPLVVKPPAGAGARDTYRIDDEDGLAACLARHEPNDNAPVLFEEFVRGSEYSYDSVVVNRKTVWHSISHYLPSPLDVLENSWIQWCVLLPRDISGVEYDPIREAAEKAVLELGMNTGLSHMEWFALEQGRIAISEVGARPPGAQITSLLSYAHDHDFYRAWPRLTVYGEFEPPERRFAAGAAYVRGQGRGKVKRILGLEEAQARCGELVVESRLPGPGQHPSDGYEGDGYIIVRHPQTEVVEQALKDILETVKVELE